MGKDRPRIAIVTPGTFPIPSDSGSSVERVVHEFTARLRDRFEFYIFGKSDPGSPPWELKDGITYIVRPAPNRARI